ncbi:CotH kinase family protein [Streptomyces sp. WAC 00631]|uniref:CotH kinase family protein n=1 Tax=Streptomyces sp. WAC 00631 TaxID=2203201 RepID=UPI001E295361|nr:CotH kinase family protein [Streptomyces sp. WAC 00631]MCC5033919.1 CotH kinase family protein [Streptomyces sp. WAC 00631]
MPGGGKARRAPGAARRRRLRDRVPVRLRHHWRPVAALCAGLAVMVYTIGDARVSPYVTSASAVEADAITQNVRGTVGLYDDSVAHTIQLEYDATDFEKMMKEFREEGSKEYIEADLTIDGVHLEDVGIRLKGNSTLMSLRGGDRGMPGGGRAVPGGAAPDGAAGGGRRPGGAGGMTMYDLSPDKPEELPWLIKIDEYIEGRAYQGEREISLRPGSGGAVPLNEALSLSLTAASGEPAERYAFSSVKVNDRPAVTRLMVENPDTEYAEAVGDGNGVLYKARAGGSFAYRGDDPSAYETSFRQLNKAGSQDLTPVIRLIKWADRASDEEFAEELGRYVDVDSLAAYTAAQNLLLNFDDMSGPGKNYLLWYDLDTKKFSVLGWDYNLAFGGDTAAGPDDSLGKGGVPAEREGTGTGADTADGRAGQKVQPPKGGTEDMPPGAPGGQNGRGPGDGEGGGGMPGGMTGHPLKDRFLELDAFDDAYKTAYRELYEKFYGSGTALRVLDRIADGARAAGADTEELSTAVARLRETVSARTEALAEDEEVTG